MGRNILFVDSNPYSEEINYSWQFPKKVDSLSADSPLNTEKFMKASVTHIAYDLLKYVEEKLYNEKYGLDIVFKGISDDYEELCSIKEAYFNDKDIEIKHDNKFTITASDALKEINAVYVDLYDYFDKYKNEEINSLLSKYRDSTRPEINLYVMGLYSSGKSAFINSLIGREILSSSGSAETAKIYRISQDSSYRVTFEFKDELCVIEYQSDSWEFKKNPDNELALVIKEKLDSVEYSSEEKAMYKTIAAINDYAKNNKTAAIGHTINIDIPFVKTELPTEEYRFVINDTPGTNSDYFADHKELLKSFMADQTNGLPVFLTNVNNAQATDNKDIVDIIRELREILDISNSILVVTQADTLDKEQCELMREERKSSIGRELRTDRLFFASSLVGLGSKKDNPKDPNSWSFMEFAKNYKNVIGNFSDPQDPFYMSLPAFNSLPENECRKVKEMEKEYEGGEKLALWNSGIPVIESEIGQFANRYALYNKCRQAQLYLHSACDRLTIQISKSKQTKETLKEKTETSLNTEMQKLKDSIESLCSEHISEYETKYINEVQQPHATDLRDKTRIKKVVMTALADTKGQSKQKVDQAINNSIKQELKTYADMVNKEAKELWKKCDEELKKKIFARIDEEDALTKDQKEKIKKTFLGESAISSNHAYVNLEKMVQTKKFFFFFEYQKVDTEGTVDSFYNALFSDLKSNNKVSLEKLRKSISDWKGRLEAATVQALASIDSNLISLSKQLSEINDELETMEMQQEKLNDGKARISSILNKEV